MKSNIFQTIPFQWRNITNNKLSINLIIALLILAYLFIAFYVFLPQCLIVWYPLGVNEFIFCFILPPAILCLIFMLKKIKSLTIKLITVFISIISFGAWFGPERFLRFITSPDWIFWDCVMLLHVLCNVFGLSYHAINIIIFCLVEPSIFLIMLFIIIKQHKTISSNLRK